MTLHKTNAQVFIDELNHVAHEFTRQNVDILILRVQQQSNGYDCGPFTVDNLVRLAQTDLNTIDELEAILYKSVNVDEIELREEHKMFDLMPEEYRGSSVWPINVFIEPGGVGTDESVNVSGGYQDDNDLSLSGEQHFVISFSYFSGIQLSEVKF